MKKKKIIGLLATLGCFAVAAGAGAITPTTASAAATIGGVDVSSFIMTYGASVRFGKSDGKNGIRFQATLDETKYAELEALEANTEKTVAVNYGMMIFPAEMTAVKENPTVAFGAGYTFEADCNPNGDECTCGKTHIASVKYAKLTDEEAGDNVVNLLGSLVDIKEANLTREFIGVGYIEYVVDGVATYEIADWALDKADTEGSSDVVNNTRSMTYVAQLAIEKGKDDANNTLQTTYVDSLAAYEFKYTVKHYLPTASQWDGADVYWSAMWNDGKENYWAFAKEEICYGTLGDALTLANEDEGVSSEFGCADYVKLFRYRGSREVTLFANGKTVLESYWRVEGEATAEQKYDITNQIANEEKETVIDNDLGDVVKVTDYRLQDGTRNTKGISMGLNYCEALAIQNIIAKDKTTTLENPTFTWTLRMKLDEPAAGGRTKKDPIVKFPGSDSRAPAENGLNKTYLSGTGAINSTSGFGYDCWVEYTFKSSLLVGYSADYQKLVNALVGETSYITITNAFGDSHQTEASGDKAYVYFDEISWSLAA